MDEEIIVIGIDVDWQTRCFHYHSPVDVIAIKFKCCSTYFACYYCHEESADHDAEIWKVNEFETKAIICGCCKVEMTINTYLQCENICPNCNTGFNPRCINHHHFYFEKSA